MQIRISIFFKCSSTVLNVGNLRKKEKLDDNYQSALMAGGTLRDLL